VYSQQSNAVHGREIDRWTLEQHRHGGWKV
jgi:hypothetical protein